jgi:hypothetical protein
VTLFAVNARPLLLTITRSSNIRLCFVMKLDQRLVQLFADRHRKPATALAGCVLKSDIVTDPALDIAHHRPRQIGDLLRSETGPHGQKAIAVLRLLAATSARTRSICVSVRTLACLPKPKVCTNDDGSPLRPHTPTHYRKRLAKRLGLPVIRFHDLRHACATHMPVLGINPKVASEKLGHSDVRDHAGLYSHVLPGIRENAAALVDQQLRAEIDKAKANN